MATNIYTRYKVLPLHLYSRVCTHASRNDCCNPPREKLRRAGRKKNKKRYEANDAIRSFARRVTVFRKSRFPQRASLAFHLDLPGVIGHSRCNGCGVSSACEPHVARCNVACCTCISSCMPRSGCIANDVAATCVLF